MKERILSKWLTLSLLGLTTYASAEIALQNLMAAEDNESVPNEVIKAEEFVKGLKGNNLVYCMPISDLITITENESEMANWVVLDVNPGQKYADAHISGSVNVPIEEMVEMMDTLPAEKKIAVISLYDTCSAFAVAMLRIYKDSEAWVVQGGLPAWQKAGKGMVGRRASVISNPVTGTFK